MKQKQYQKMNWAEIESIIYSDCSHPFEILGPHTVGKEVLLQAFFPYAKKVCVCFSDEPESKLEMEQVEEEGFFAVFFPKRKNLKYHYEIRKGDVSKSENGIGIIPHIYEDSRGYWQEREARDRGIVAAIEEQIRQAQSQNIIEVKMKRKKRHVKTAAEMLAEVDMEED